MCSLALDLALWAIGYDDTAEDRELADRSLLDTIAVAIAGRGEPAAKYAGVLEAPGRWAVGAHVMDFDDLHMESTAHISAVCVPAAIGAGGGRGAYLAGAGVMARLGVALGWPHYSLGWHATCTAGAPAAAVAAAVALGLDVERVATAMALALPAAGGVQGAFGTDAKSLQVGSAVDAGIRAARLAQSGATAELRALDDWLVLVGGDPNLYDASGPAVPVGLALKLYPCCYALQRPIEAVAELQISDGIVPARVDRIRVRTPASTVKPLISRRPQTGLEGKFSLRYAVAAALMDDSPGLSSFTDDAVNRPEAIRLMQRTEVVLEEGGSGLLDDEFQVEADADGQTFVRRRRLPAGAPGLPPSAEQINRKVTSCLDGAGVGPDEISWGTAAAVLEHMLPGRLAATGPVVPQRAAATRG